MLSLRDGDPETKGPSPSRDTWKNNCGSIREQPKPGTFPNPGQRGAAACQALGSAVPGGRCRAPQPHSGSAPEGAETRDGRAEVRPPPPPPGGSGARPGSSQGEAGPRGPGAGGTAAAGPGRAGGHRRGWPRGGGVRPGPAVPQRPALRGRGGAR